MKLVRFRHGLWLVRENDCRIYHESTITHHIRRLLNLRCRKGRWVRCRPDRIGLTVCKQGVANWEQGVVYWHGAYAVEDAAQKFNAGKVFFNAARVRRRP